MRQRRFDPLRALRADRPQHADNDGDVISGARERMVMDEFAS